MSLAIAAEAPATIERDDRVAAPEAAEILGIPLSTLYRAVRGNSVPHWRIGRVVRFSRRQLMEITGELRPTVAA